jgi:hypothetical protein
MLPAPSPQAPPDLVARIARFADLREQASVADKLRPEMFDGFARVLRLVFDVAEAIDARTLRLERVGMPGAILFDTVTGEWRSTVGEVHGCGWLEAAAWARDRDLIGTAALLYAGRFALPYMVAR